MFAFCPAKGPAGLCVRAGRFLCPLATTVSIWDLRIAHGWRDTPPSVGLRGDITEVAGLQGVSRYSCSEWSGAAQAEGMVQVVTRAGHSMHHAHCVGPFMR